MDRASAIRIVYPGRSSHPGNARTNQPWPNGSFIAALCWLTNLGLIEKGRMIEIEAIYCSLFALALILWLVFWEQKRSPWLTFIVPWIFLGLGLLAKVQVTSCSFILSLAPFSGKIAGSGT
jgi:4-amino-4-deoxy-L-arabinose transferase-like glycosyltransferase